LLTELLFELAWLVFELVVELLLEGGIDGLVSAYKRTLGRENRDPVIAAVGYALLGAAFGQLSLWLVPGRLLPAGPFPGLSVLIATPAAGWAMQRWGRHRRARGSSPTNLATFPGGAAFAGAFSLVRLSGLM
jgi:hypothetical protein